MEQKENNKLEKYNRLKSDEILTIVINNFKRRTNCKKTKYFFYFLLFLFLVYIC